MNDMLDKEATKNIITRIVKSYGGTVTVDWGTGELIIDLENNIEACGREIEEGIEKHRQQQQKTAEYMAKLKKKCEECPNCESCSNCHG